MKVLVTGSSGYIGENLKRFSRLAHCGNYLFTSRICEQVNSLECDIVRDDLSRVLSGVDIVVNLAQSQFYRNFPEKADDIFKVNVLGTQRLLDASYKAGIKRFINISSGNVYGNLDVQAKEDMPCNPLDFYAKSKAISESLVTSYSNYFDSLNIRLFTPYGPNQSDKLIASIVEKIYSNDELYFADNIGLYLNPIFIDDLCSALVKVIEHPKNVSGAFNLGGNEVVSLKSIAHMISEVTNLDLRYTVTEDNPRSFVCDSSLFYETFNFSPEVNMKEGVSRII